MDNETFEELRQKMLSLFFREGNIALFSILSSCVEMNKNSERNKDTDMHNMLNSVTNMCMMLARDMEMLKLIEVSSDSEKVQREIIGCNAFMESFSRNCSRVLGIKINVKKRRKGEIWINSSRRVLEYALLCFIRKNYRDKFEYITLSCSKKDKKITIKLLTECNLKEETDPLTEKEKSEQLFIDIIQNAVPYIIDAKCVVSDSEMKIILNEAEMMNDGNINLSDSDLTDAESIFSSYHIMLSDIAEYSFFK
ncbi:MAG: hypothetical protein J6I55_10985 [Ruminococcus sp.]|nr:hypothetical protein [Ruminococcus sp.]